MTAPNETELRAIVEAACLFAAAARGKAGGAHGYGIGDASSPAYGAAQQAKAIADGVVAIGDLEMIAAMARSLSDLKTYTDGLVWSAAALSPVLSALDRVAAGAALSGVRGLDDLLGYYNDGKGGGGYWSVLADPLWHGLWSAYRGSTPPSPKSVGAYSDDLGTRAHGGPFAAGASIDSSKYAGGFPRLKVSSLGGSGTATVTGTARSPVSMALTAGATWTLAASGNGTFALSPGGGSPAPADSLILGVSAIDLGAGISAGTFTVQCETSCVRAAV